MPYFSLSTVENRAADALGTSRDDMTNQLAFDRLLRLVEEIDKEYPLPELTTRAPVVFDIFLSFSSVDARQVLGIYYLLTSRKYVAYLDRIIDPYLSPANVTRATAEVLRRRMAQSKSLFVATSQNTPQSAWVPWELGFSDGWRGKAAVLPIVAGPQQSFAGRSYFELYPVVQDVGVALLKGKDLEIWDLGIRIGTWDDWLQQPQVV